MKKLLLTLLLSLGFIDTAAAETVINNTLKLNALNSCVSCNLNGANLKGLFLNGANLSGANLSGASLRDTDLSGAKLCNTETPWGVDDSGC